MAADEAAGIERRIVTRHLRRPGRLHRAGRAARPRRRPRSAGAVPRARPPRDRVVRRRRREVHRRRGDGRSSARRSRTATTRSARCAPRSWSATSSGELAGGDLQIRIAVNTGEAVVSLGARPALGESMVAGDVVNTAARLQAAAPINGVVVGEETYRDDAGRDRVRSRPSPWSRKARSIRSARGSRSSRGHDGGRAAAGGPAIVGRAGELAILRRVLGACRRASGCRTSSRSSDRPASASRRSQASSAGLRPKTAARVVRGRSLPYRESGTYGVLATQLMQLAGVFESDAAEVIVEKLRRRAERAARRHGRRPGARRRAPRRRSSGSTRAPRRTDREALFDSAAAVPRGARRASSRRSSSSRTSTGPMPTCSISSRRSRARARDLPLLFVTLSRPELLDMRAELGAGLLGVHGADARPARRRACA